MLALEVVMGLILSIVVGGGLLLAAWMVWAGKPHALLASLGAGFVLLGWIVEADMVRDGRALEAVIFAYSLSLIGLAWSERRHGRQA